jgi:hypothetical protein
MKPRARQWLLAGGLALAAALQTAGQTPVVPTQGYGPPACTAGARPPARPKTLDQALAEQKDALANPSIVLSGEPLPNFDTERARLIEYGDCTGSGACYWADLDAQFRRAEAELKQHLEHRSRAEKLAIVMDIDETTLTNYCEMRREDFGYIPELHSVWETSADAATAIPGALRLFNEARAAGLAVFFITGRPGIPDYSAPSSSSDETGATARNLEAAGFHGWAGLQLRNGAERGMTTIDYKSEERRRITLKGYRIVLSVGDQWSDLLGEPQADVSFKLPNPFYFIP